MTVLTACICKFIIVVSLYNISPLSGFQVRVIVESGGQNATVTLDVIWYCMVCLVSALETLHEVTRLNTYIHSHTYIHTYIH